MQSLVESLPDLARVQGAVTAVRDRSGPAWRFLSWSELMGEVNRVAGVFGERVERGQRVAWSAPAGTRRVIIDLALLHLGVVGAEGAPGAEAIDVETYEGFVAAREQAGRLVRLTAELRGRDPAVEYRRKVLPQQAVLELAKRVSAAVGLVAPDVVLVSAPGPAEQSCAWGALVEGYGMVVGGPELLPSLSPKAWLATPEQVRGVVAGGAAARSGAGRLRTGLRRALGRVDPLLGEQLARVFVDGAVPPEAQALRERGVEVIPWPA